MSDHQIELLVTWISKERFEGQENLDRLFELDDLYREVYRKNRIIKSFTVAAKMANKAVIQEINKSK